MDFLYTYLTSVWEMILDMAPYLLVGFAIAGLLHKVISQSWIEKRLGKAGFGSTILASLVGVPMPLCSCGVVPVTASIRNKGASKGATTSFLTSTPQTGIDSILATYGMLGPLFAIYRVVVAFVSGVFVGVVIETVSSKENLTQQKTSGASHSSPTWKESFVYAFSILPQSIGNSLIIGFLIAGLISAVAPENLLAELPGGIYSSILLTTFIAIPLYVCSTGSIPLAIALVDSGLPISAALVLLIAGPATNAATVATMRKIIGSKETLIYLACIIISSWLAAFVFELLFGDKSIDTATTHMHSEYGIISILSALILLATITWPYLISSKKKPNNTMDTKNEKLTFSVSGMSCNHCKASIVKSLSEIEGVKTVDVDLSKKLVNTIGTNLQKELIGNKIKTLGFELND